MKQILALTVFLALAATAAQAAPVQNGSATGLSLGSNPNQAVRNSVGRADNPEANINATSSIPVDANSISPAAGDNTGINTTTNAGVSTDDTNQNSIKTRKATVR